MKTTENLPAPDYSGIADLDELLALLQCGADLPMDRLPKFGGVEPQCTLGIWSWDRDHLLIGDGIDDLLVVPRPVIPTRSAQRLEICHEATIAYLTCALWSSNDESDESYGEPFLNNYSLEDIDANAISVADGLCRAWVDMVRLVLSEEVEITASDEQIGHDLWLTRNGHGAGFWDRPELYGSQSLADTLSDAATLLGEVHPYLGDDGVIYLS